MINLDTFTCSFVLTTFALSFRRALTSGRPGRPRPLRQLIIRDLFMRLTTRMLRATLTWYTKTAIVEEASSNSSRASGDEPWVEGFIGVPLISFAFPLRSEILSLGAFTLLL